MLGRGPSERAAGAERILGDLLEQRISEPVESRTVEGTVVISVASRGVLVVTPADVDDLAGETLEGVTSQAVAQLRLALHEAIEARTPAVILGLTARALAGLSVGVLLLWALHRGQRIAAAKLVAISERTLARTGIDDVEALRASRLFNLQRWVVTAVTGGLALVVAYSTSTFVLRSFPYTRPWGESMSHFLLMTSEDLALSIANAIPGLFTVALIFVLARFVVRAVGLWFNAVERERVRVRWLYPETAQPTRRLVTALLWLFAIVMAYPFMPGSRDGRVQGRQRVHRTHRDVRVERPRQPDHERVHDHLLARVRVGDFVDRRRPGDGRSSRCSVHEGEDRLERRGHDSERRRRGANDDGLFARRSVGGRLHADVRDDWLRRAVASGARNAFAGGRADSGNPPQSTPFVVQEGLQTSM